MKMQSKVPAKKVVAAGLGGGTGGAVAELLVYLIESFGTVDLPPRIETAITVIIVAAFAFGGGYLTPPSPDDQVVPE